MSVHGYHYYTYVHTCVHACTCGLPVHEYVPLAKNDEAVVCQYVMTTLEELGLLKMDFLGLRNLTVLDDAVKLVQEHTPDFRLQDIPEDDKETFEMISRGQTSGVFQMESTGMTGVCVGLKPQNIEDITAIIALYRPGPMDSIPRFIACKHDPRLISYKHPSLEPILSITYGCIVYQEQVIQIFQQLGGYSLGQADMVRRAISKKKASQIQKEKDAFIHGDAERGITGCVAKATAEAIYQEIYDFANYAFNKAHAVSYAVVAYQTAYFKCHYPREYMAALLTSVLDSAPKLAEYIGECTKLGIPVYKPDIVESRVDFSVSGKGIRFGLLAVRGVGRQFLENVILEREKRPFKNFEDFINRMSDHDLNRRQVEALVKCGALDSLGDTRRTMLVACETLIGAAQQKARTNLAGQIDFFSEALGGEAPRAEYTKLPEFEKKELLAYEREYIGICFSGHPLDEYATDVSATPHSEISEILGAVDENGEIIDPAYHEKMKLTVVGVVTSRTEKNTRNGEKMAFVTIEDRFGEIELLVFPNQYRRFAGNLVPDSAVLATGELSTREGEAPKLLLSALRPLRPENDSAQVAEKKLYIRVDSLVGEKTARARELIDHSPGTTPVVFYDLSSRRYSAYVGRGVRLDDALLLRLGNLLGDGSVVVK